MKHVHDPSTAVVMLRSGHHGGLGIARSLGRLGVPVYSVDATRWEPVFTSRYCRRRFLLDVESLPPDLAVERLREIGRKVGARPILLPTTDQACMWLADNADALSLDFHFPAIDTDLVHTLCDKSRMQELAHQYGVPIARSMTPRSKADVSRFLDEAAFPLMVKETGGGRLRARAGASKFVVQTRSEVFHLYDRAADPENPNLMLQEFVPGVDWMFNGYFDSHSRCLFGMTGKKIRRFPAHTGVTSLGVCLANETVIRTTTEFMQNIGYRGILDIGYRWDMRDGSYRVLDINPRIGCTFRLFTSSDGMDVARALYLDLTGQPVPAAKVGNGRKWLVEDFDLFSALRSWREGGLSIKEWIGSLAGVEEAACFAFDDPFPFFMLGIFDCCELFRWTRGQAEVRHQIRPVAEPVPVSAIRRY
jgi:predicted ATP-grasp superfamily ATP-dependent carboligase